MSQFHKGADVNFLLLNLKYLTLTSPSREFSFDKACSKAIVINLLKKKKT